MWDRIVGNVKHYKWNIAEHVQVRLCLRTNLADTDRHRNALSSSNLQEEISVRIKGRIVIC